MLTIKRAPLAAVVESNVLETLRLGSGFPALDGRGFVAELV
jgi:hypothetical protein